MQNIIQPDPVPNSAWVNNIVKQYSEYTYTDATYILDIFRSSIKAYIFHTNAVIYYNLFFCTPSLILILFQ